ncbi:GTP 3',8-cyclase MoaA [Saccharibacter floricola]|uniref:GTP 3',8-cyclase MoaA n=1 Tax=Saccharibacter floricola TaxID=231053 RepID=UPI000A056DAA|nr:GTP 3',8-cyclase MoaA [Saccharibacter floricola]
MGVVIRDQYGRAWRDLRLSIIDRCPFRCPYCMPETDYPDGFRFLASNERLSVAEMVTIARSAVRLGVRKIRLTGGEPLLHPQLLELVEALAALEGVEDLALTTNGVLLPQLAKPLQRAGLRRVTVSLDALDSVIFSHMSGGRGHVEHVLSGIEAACQAQFPDGVKINSVVQRGVNEREVPKLAAYGAARQMNTRFIEYMDVGTRNGWQRHEVVTADEIYALLEQNGPLERIDLRYEGEVATRYRYRGTDREVGIIASVTMPFCGTCTRARLSSDGRFYTCLFAQEGKDLRSVVRHGGPDAVEEVLHTLWQRRSDRYSEKRAGLDGQKSASQRVEMNYIGG